MRPGCGVWSRKSSANNSSNTWKFPPPCTSSVFRRTTAFAASLILILVITLLQPIRAAFWAATSSSNSGLLPEKLQFPCEGGPGGAGVRQNPFAKRLRGVLASPVALPFARDRQPIHRHHASHHHAAHPHLMRLDADSSRSVGDSVDLIILAGGLDRRHGEADFRPECCHDQLLAPGLLHR